MISTKKLLLPMLISSIFITACAGTSANKPDHSGSNHATNPANSAAALTAMKWQLVSRQDSGQAASATLKSGDAASRYQMLIINDCLSISGGCNAMGGAVTLGAPNTFSVGPLLSTKRACIGTAKSLMRSDSEISGYLSRVNQYAINNQTLTLMTANGQKLNFKGTATPETQYGSKGVQKFIELTSTKNGIQWREAKYNKSWVRIKDNAPWQSNFPSIQGFTPKVGMGYIVRLHEYKDPKTQRAVWVKDMVITSEVL